jgi:hypothetical protein
LLKPSCRTALAYGVAFKRTLRLKPEVFVDKKAAGSLFDSGCTNYPIGKIASLPSVRALNMFGDAAIMS